MKELIALLREEASKAANGYLDFCLEAADALERLTAERDAALAASRHETDLCQQALEDLEKFAAENAALREGLDAYKVSLQAAKAEVIRLIAERDALRADAERYRKLRRQTRGALLGEERAISDALALRVDELKAELGDLPESQREMMAEIKRLKAYAAKADIELGNLEDKLRESHAMSATLSHAARVSHHWEQDEINKVKARVRAALEEPK